MEDVWADESVAQRNLLREAPWNQSPFWFQEVHISALALAKMAQHSRNGGSNEVMGVLTGKIKNSTFVVLDSYSLPVEATETRVNAMGEAYEYMVRYLEMLHESGSHENIVGWYHSHPGYGCWLSRIDVGTQEQNQMFQDPYVALVIDPERSPRLGKVDIGAFRTLPEGTKSDSSRELYGAYADRYYPLKISYFGVPELLDQVYTPPLASLPTTAASDVDRIAQRLERLAHVGGRARSGASGDLMALTRKSASKFLSK